MKLDWKTHIGALLLIFIILFGCKSADEETDCVNELNQKNYSKVASDTSCTTYERASAYMGLAGFQFSNFLAADASDNFRQALGVSSSVTAWETWSGKTYYENAMALTGDSTGDTYEGQTREKEDVEIHYFATLGALMALTYIELDADSDGEVEEDEIQSFTGIREENDANYGQNEIAAADWIEFVTDKGTGSEKVYLLNMTDGTCTPQTAAPKYDGLWDGTSYGISTANCGIIPTPSAATILQWQTDGAGSISISGECAAVVKIEELQNLFESSSGGSVSVLDLTEYFVTYVNAIESDLVELGIEEDSDLRKGLSEFSENIDNGATCSNDTLTEIDQVFNILDVASENAASDYENVNLLAFSEISTASDTTVALTDFSTVVEYATPALIPITITFSCDNADNLDARLVYKSGANYVPYYSGADANINDTFTTLNDLNTDTDGNVKPDTANDEIISFRELICME